MASTCYRPTADHRTHKSIVELGFQFPKPPNPSDASVFGCAARFNLSVMETPGSSTDLRSAELPEDREISDSDDDDDDLPSRGQILASPKWVIDLTSDDHDDSEEGDNDILAEVSWLRNTRTARRCVRLTPPSLIDRFPVVDQTPSPPTALPAKVTGTQRRRPRNLVCSGHTR
jgi:hypothetical protein